MRENDFKYRLFLSKLAYFPEIYLSLHLLETTLFFEQSKAKWLKYIIPHVSLARSLGGPGEM